MRSFPTVSRDEELGLLAAVITGDHAAGTSFFQRYNCLIEMCVRKTFRRAGLFVTEEDVRDMVGEIWLSLLDDDKRCLRRFEPDRQIRVGTWIGLLARNKTIDHLRTSHERTVPLDDALVADERPFVTASPTDEVEAREAQVLAERALQLLKAEERRFLEAWYVHDRDPSDMAHEFGIAVGTVYSRRFKIQEKLARTIDRISRPRRIYRARALAA
ncbi:MAG: sigma-70 family RNA polymerase sigma factor [Deltaproteobacteria bacterium]|nr:sigma-70 family RNA polymerase sigma factor [Deltaproteobacteria bacterium]